MIYSPKQAPSRLAAVPSRKNDGGRFEWPRTGLRRGTGAKVPALCGCRRGSILWFWIVKYKNTIFWCIKNRKSLHIIPIQPDFGGPGSRHMTRESFSRPAPLALSRQSRCHGTPQSIADAWPPRPVSASIAALCWSYVCCLAPKWNFVTPINAFLLAFRSVPLSPRLRINSNINRSIPDIASQRVDTAEKRI